jgi:hypothetical protein
MLLTLPAVIKQSNSQGDFSPGIIRATNRVKVGMLGTLTDGIAIPLL